jgi:hypothetical protein
LPADATEDDHFALLGLLNSSAACFWMKQVCYNKGAGGVNEGFKQEDWEQFREFAATGLRAFPVADGRAVCLPIARELNGLAQSYVALNPAAMLDRETPSPERLAANQAEADRYRAVMVALQEELDWLCYRLYGILSGDLCYSGDDLPGVALGQRAFEIVMARQMRNGELQTTWFERHGSTPITEPPTNWPETYRQLVERRIKAIEANQEIALIERPEHKRRWNAERWEDQDERALRSWLLERLESPSYRKGTPERPELTPTYQMADRASGDHDFLQVAAIYRGRPDFNVAALVNELIESESVPFLPALRYKPTGLRKREVWERTWDLQRKQDAGEDVGDIPVPPKYVTADFLKQDFWRLRGKLDVPKERWISFPYLQTESDPSLVVGWAGWDHLQQATALVSYYDARRREGWDATRLTPILAGLDQLLPWIHQWHPEIDAEFGETAGQSYQTMLEHDAHELGLTLDDIRKWQPPQTTRRRARV